MHKMTKKRHDGIPVFCCDYMISENYTATLIMIDRRSKWIFAHIVLHKGSQRHWYRVSAMMSDLEFTGYRIIVVKTDQENAITDFI